jgi:hypothetical protein
MKEFSQNSANGCKVLNMFVQFRASVIPIAVTKQEAENLIVSQSCVPFNTITFIFFPSKLAKH